MGIYLVVFIIVTCLTNISQKVYKKSRYGSYAITFVCILILSTFAALRSNNVGTDIQVYGLKYFERANLYTDIGSYLGTFKNEYLYYIVNFIVFKIFSDIHVLFFVFQFFVSSVVYYIAYKNKGKMYLYIITYLLLIYNSTFNILRQTPAIFIVLFGFKYLKGKQYFKYFICLAIAYFFHSSTYICIIIPIIEYMSTKKHKYIISIITITIMIVLMSSLQEFLPVFQSSDLISDKYMVYLKSEKNNFNMSMLCLKIIMALTLVFFSNKKELEDNYDLTMITIVDIILFCSGILVVYGYRMSYYMLPYYIYIIPQIDQKIENKKFRLLFRFVMIIELLVYWYVRYVFYKYDGTIPYEFFWQ